MHFFVQAPAKINLHLEIAPPDGSGFHPLRSIFMMVTLFDDLTVELLEHKEMRLEGFPPELPMEKNILYLCWKRAVRKGWFDRGIALKVKKRIPMEAGLGGGSSDCAALLKIMREISPAGMTQENTWKLAEEMGSDVPFFLCSPLAYVEGRGEKIYPINEIPRGFFFLVKPDFSVSTAEAFRQLDLSRAPGDWKGFHLDRKDLSSALGKNAATWPFFNSFSEYLESQYPLYPLLLEELGLNGSLYSGISGSGSSFFGFFKDPPDPSLIKKIAKNKKASHYSVEPLEKNTKAVVI